MKKIIYTILFFGLTQQANALRDPPPLDDLLSGVGGTGQPPSLECPGEVCPEESASGALTPEDMRCFTGMYLGRDNYQKQKDFLGKIASLITPALNNSIKKFAISSTNQDLSMFISQLMHESDGFRRTTEIGSYRYYGENPIILSILTDEVEDHNKFCDKYKKSSQGGERYFDKPRRRFYCRGKNVKSKMRTNKYPSRWRGRGLIQLTHCINYLQYASFNAYYKHCKNKSLGDCIKYAKRKSKTRFFYEGGDGVRKEVSFKSGNLQCSEDVLSRIIERFKSKHGVNLDEDKVLTDSYTLANVCSPKHLADAAAWFWTKGGSSCQRLATGKITTKRKCRCKDSTKKRWTARYVRNPDGSLPVDKNGEPTKAKCVFGKRKGKCGSHEEINHSSLSATEKKRIAGATICINGAYCYGLAHRSELYRKIRDYLKLSRSGRRKLCSRFQ